MTNIPTELLRTLVTVVDLRSFTKAARELGITQPAVSAQIKRLQALLGGELFDKSAPGVMLTAKGEQVVAGARRLLAINDQILHAALPRASRQTLRVGIAPALSPEAPIMLLGKNRAAVAPWRLEIRRDGSEDMLNDLDQEQMDLVIALTESEPDHDARHQWSEPLSWVRGRAVAFDISGPVPLIACDAKTDLMRVATSALERDGRDWEIVCRVPDDASLTAAVAAGLGIAPAVRRFAAADVAIWSDAPLPPLPEFCCGVYLRHGAGRGTIADIADAMADALRPLTDGSQPDRFPVAPIELGGAPHGSDVGT